jgi:hypothetical protein
MAKKQNWLIFPSVHSERHSEKVEAALLAKAQELFGEDESFKFFLLTGNFLGTHGYTYSALRQWPGAIKPESGKSRRPVLDAQFACLSIYLSGLVSMQVDYNEIYKELMVVLEKSGREDLADIVEEKLPFVSMPPKQMLKEGQTPITPYYIIKNDDDMLLGEMYPSVQLTEIAETIRSRYFVFFSYQGFSAFGFFDNLPEVTHFGFGVVPKEFDKTQDEDGITEFIEKDVENLKDLFAAFITVYNNSLMIQYMIDDYESLLNRILEYKMEGLD